MARKPAPNRARFLAKDRLRVVQNENARKKQQQEEEEKDDGKGTFVFFHPDLGIGGAERLVVDAAVGLQDKGHKVVIFTNHCDPEHCFDECRDGTLDVRVRASGPIPMSIFNRLTILCAILRHIQMLLTLALTGELAYLQPTTIIVDQLSAGLPLLRYLQPAVPVLFYCHFPDMLLARRSSWIKKLYRLPFDTLEEWSMGFAQGVAVNSEFTKGVASATWPSLQDKVKMRVVYPCVDLTKDKGGKVSERLLEGQKVVLSINRFERKKNIDLALQAFAAVPEDQRSGARLVIAGGYDHRIDENVSYLAELQRLASSLSLTHDTITADPDATPSATASSINASHASVLFLPSISNATKAGLLRTARLLVYTPSNEHFGIVPLEAMRSRVPVLADTTGGPVETVVDGSTGWLRDSNDRAAWTDIIARLLGEMPDDEVKKMGEAGLARVRDTFGRDQMANRLETVIAETLRVQLPRRVLFNTFLNFLIVVMAFAIGLGFAKTYWTVQQMFSSEQA